MSQETLTKTLTTQTKLLPDPITQEQPTIESLSQQIQTLKSQLNSKIDSKDLPQILKEKTVDLIDFKFLTRRLENIDSAQKLADIKLEQLVVDRDVNRSCGSEISSFSDNLLKKDQDNVVFENLFVRLKNEFGYLRLDDKRKEIFKADSGSMEVFDLKEDVKSLFEKTNLLQTTLESIMNRESVEETLKNDNQQKFDLQINKLKSIIDSQERDLIKLKLEIKSESEKVELIKKDTQSTKIVKESFDQKVKETFNLMDKSFNESFEKKVLENSISIEESLKLFNQNLESKVQQNFNSIKGIESDLIKFDLEFNHKVESLISKMVETQTLNVLKIEKIVEDSKKSKPQNYQKLNVDVEIKNDIKLITEKLQKLSKEKVDLVVLEELMRHIATREELKGTFKKLSSTISSSSSSESIQKHFQIPISQQIQTLEDSISKKIDEKIKLTTTINHEILKSTLQTSFDSNLKNPKLDQKIISIISQHSTPQQPTNAQLDLQTDQLENLAQSITREFDEKLYLVCKDLSQCKQSWEMAQTHPFIKTGCWLWNTGNLKQGSAVPWNLETTNTDPENFKWTQNHSSIKIKDAGIYELSFTFFTKSKPSIQIVVNGESVMSAINSPSYVVQHGSGIVVDGDGRCVEGTVSGLSLVDFLCVPGKSSLAVHYHGKKSGHGFLSLRRVC